MTTSVFICHCVCIVSYLAVTSLPPLLSAACVGEPANVTGMETISSSFSGDSGVGAQVTYTCEGPLTTAAGDTAQTVNCTQEGWLGDVLPCEGQSAHHPELGDPVIHGWI